MKQGMKVSHDVGAPHAFTNRVDWESNFNEESRFVSLGTSQMPDDKRHIIRKADATILDR
jgi:hypothetical protein